MPRNIIYEIFMLVLSVFVLIILFFSYIPKISPEIKEIIYIVDLFVCLIFFLDFIGNLIFSKNRLHYLKWGWLDLLSSIPILHYGPLAKSVRIFKIIRLLRGIRSANYLISFIKQYRSESVLLSMILSTIVLVTISSVCILHFESSGNSNISTAQDAVWWAFVTVTTVGYGDFYPVTTGGRIIASILMVFGIGIFGSYTGYMANLLVSSTENKH